MPPTCALLSGAARRQHCAFICSSVFPNKVHSLELKVRHLWPGCAPPTPFPPQPCPALWSPAALALASASRV